MDVLLFHLTHHEGNLKNEWTLFVLDWNMFITLTASAFVSEEDNESLSALPGFSLTSQARVPWLWWVMIPWNILHASLPSFSLPLSCLQQLQPFFAGNTSVNIGSLFNRPHPFTYFTCDHASCAMLIDWRFLGLENRTTKWVQSNSCKNFTTHKPSKPLLF